MALSLIKHLYFKVTPVSFGVLTNPSMSGWDFFDPVNKLCLALHGISSLCKYFLV